VRPGALIVAVLGVASIAGAAEADTPASPSRGDRSEAKRLADRAQVHFNLGEYDKAIFDYREAYRLVPSPGLLYNLGQAYRLLGDCVSATTMYRNYLRLAPHSPYRQLVKQHLSALADCDRASATVTAETDPLLAHATPAVAPSFSATSVGDVEARAPGPRHEGRGKKTIGIALGAGGIVLAGVGAYYSVDAAHTADEVSALYADGAPWDRIAKTDQRGQRAETLGVGFALAGGAALATGATFYLLGWREDRRAELAVVPRAGGAAVTLGWGF